MGLRAAGLAIIAAAMALAPASAHAAAVDAAFVDGTFTFSPGLGPFPQTVSLSFAGGCPSLGAPTFVEAPGDSAAVTLGACTSLTMSGTFTSVSCGFGEGSGTFALSEPAGDTASGTFVIVVTGGLALLTMPLSYGDDGGAGPAVGMFELTPSLAAPPSGTCLGTMSTELAAGVITGLHT
ncbi:MAG TPA: hypothetical protein VGQ42_16695 [Candidatus Dormibacteraeota bacterium]|nr:hypothetical protein [Candidatus Dormibacteraeota bacterium]